MLTTWIKGRVPVSSYLDVPQWRELDWLQSHEQAGIVPLEKGRALGVLPSIPDVFDETADPMTIFDPETLKWSSFTFPNESFDGPTYGGRFAVDSRGWLHYVHVDRQVVYRMSSDGGRHWSTAAMDLPEGFSMHGSYYVSLKTNGAWGMSVVAVHAQGPTGDAQDLVYRFDTDGSTPRLQRIYFVGLGDLDTGAGLTSTASERFDFPTVTLLPGGRIAVSFGDSLHRDPAIAVELGPAR